MSARQIVLHGMGREICLISLILENAGTVESVSLSAKYKPSMLDCLSAHMVAKWTDGSWDNIPNICYMVRSLE